MTPLTPMTPTTPKPGEADDVLDRGGHLSELALDRYRFDPPEPTFHEAVTAHLGACAACQSALDALIAEDATSVLDPPTAVAPVIPMTARRPWAALGAVDRTPRRTAWIAGGMVFALAAIALLVTRPWQPGEDLIRLKGSPLDLEIYVHDGERSRPVVAGDVVHPGERMGFRVHLRQDGYLAIFGRDDRGTSYPCYPLNEGPGPTLAPTATALEAVAQPRTEHPLTLPVAMRFDDILGDEHITAVFCESPFALGPAPTEMAAELDRAGCQVVAVTLRKRSIGEAP